MKTLATAFLVASIAMVSRVAPAADLFTLGTWVATFSAHDLVAGAGSGFPSHVESITAASTLTIANTSGPWSVRVHRSSGHEADGVTICVRRTSNGSGPGTITGGTSYVELTGTDIELFSGSEDRTGVTIQFKLVGVSHRTRPDTYSSNLVFTIQ